MDQLKLLERRLAREKSARAQAEELIEQKSREIYHANQELGRFNADLEERIDEATADVQSKNELLTRRVRELDALHNVAMALTSEIRIAGLLERIMHVSKDVMHAEAGSILLLDETKKSLNFFMVSGSGSGALKPLSVNVGSGIAGHVAQTGDSLRVRDVYEDPRFDPTFDERTGSRSKSMLATPILNKGEVVGVLQVINNVEHAEFDEHDLDLFKSLASSIGVALENAKLFEQTKAMADDLRDALEQERRLSIEKEKMGAYIPKHVVDEISRNREQKLALGGKMVRGTVLFSDLKGFTKMAENMEAQRLIGLLNLYMTAMTDIIESEQGTIDKFLGDGIMATFTVLDENDCAATRAIRVGIRMQSRLTELRGQWKSTHPEASNLEMRVGINTGDMVAGNIGSETRMEFTVIGDNVNVASRIEAACSPGQVWVSDSTYLDAHGEFEATRMEPIQVKNRTQPVQIYAIKAE
jgi:adenylate cyclase